MKGGNRCELSKYVNVMWSGFRWVSKFIDGASYITG